MECLTTAGLYSYSNRGRLFNVSAMSLAGSRPPIVASQRSAAITVSKGLPTSQGPLCHRLQFHLKNVNVESCHGEIIGLHLPRLRNRALQAGRETKFTVSATARPLDAEQASVESGPSRTKSLIDSGLDWLGALHRFSRPHTVIGSAFGIISVSMLALQSPAELLSSQFLWGLLQALIPALFMNIYIVGLNQIYDVDIDKVNKPYLPLASGEYSMGMAVAIVLTSAIVSVTIGVMVGSRPLLWALLVSLVLGTAYSVDVPLLRWKKSALAAASCILAVRAIVVQLGFYFHMQAFIFGRSAVMNRPLLFATAFMSFFSVVIALAKDMPDVEGDKIYGIRSFSVRLGHQKVFWLCVWLIQAAYAVAMAVGVTSPVLWGKLSMIVGHAVLATILWKRAKSVDLKSKAAITSFYMFIWQLFYAEYLILPFVR